MQRSVLVGDRYVHAPCVAYTHTHEPYIGANDCEYYTVGYSCAIDDAEIMLIVLARFYTSYNLVLTYNYCVPMCSAFPHTCTMKMTVWVGINLQM